MRQVRGLHHITAIAGEPQANLDFYTRLLGMRLVKKSVNQDDPGTYHFFFADGAGSPGTDLTFFPWTQLAPSRLGVGLNVEVPLAIPSGSLDYWRSRLGDHGVRTGDIGELFGEPFLPLVDPHGLKLSLIELSGERPFVPWQDGPVPKDKQIRGLHAARLWERDLRQTGDFLEQVLGFRRVGEDGGWHRFEVGAGGSGTIADVRALPQEQRGRWGTGSVHHVAWRVADAEEQIAVRAEVERAGRRPTEVIDRFWFKSVYFTEPGGVLFELATDGPGFAVDEAIDALGSRLILPPWLEPRREEIEAALPAVEQGVGERGG